VSRSSVTSSSFKSAAAIVRSFTSCSGSSNSGRQNVADQDDWEVFDLAGLNEVNASNTSSIVPFRRAVRRTHKALNRRTFRRRATASPIDRGRRSAAARGSLVLHPTECLRRAPRFAASIRPGPPPVITVNPGRPMRPTSREACTDDPRNMSRSEHGDARSDEMQHRKPAMKSRYAAQATGRAA
jgi:hypothetical protein